MPRRRLSPEELELWRRVVDAAAPLHPERPDPADPDPGPDAASAPKPAPPVRPRGPGLPPARPPEPGRTTLDLSPDPHAALARANPHMDRRRFDKLRRGRLEPEARLDLHGMTAERAHGALNSFISGAHASGLRLVLVITGKGRDGHRDALAPERRGVLRHNVPHWLNAPALARKVLQVAPAHIRHGGGGAYYVYLRRAR